MPKNTKKNKGKGNKSGQARIEGPPPPPPPPPPYPKQGNTGITYILKKETPKTFDYIINDFKRGKIIYYDGVIHYPDEFVKLEASFVCFEESEEAARIFDCAQRISHPRVLRAYFYSTDSDIEKSFVCFEKFDAFISDIPDPYLTFLNNPTSSPYFGVGAVTVGNPNEFVQSQIREINDALLKMHNTTISSSNLDMDCGYFWCAGDNMVKIMADQLFWRADDMKLATKQDMLEWQNIKESHVDKFVKGLERFFAKTGTACSKFIASLSVPHVRKDERLLFISNHPILENEALKIMERFSRIVNRLESMDSETMVLSRALFNMRFNSEFIPGGEWNVEGMDPAFEKVFLYPNSNYHLTLVRDILKFIRNVHEHRLRVKLSVDQIFAGIQLKWPYLIYRVYEYYYKP